MLARFHYWLYQFLLKILIILESVILIRLIFKFLKANPKTPAISYFYKTTDHLVYPFNNAFPDLNLKPIGVSGALETASLMSAVGYFLIFLLIIGLTKLLVHE